MKETENLIYNNKIYRCVKGDIGRHLSMSSDWLILSKKRMNVILNLKFSKLPVILIKNANHFIDLFILFW